VQRVIRLGILLILTSLCLSVSAQNKPKSYKELYYEAEILVQNAIYDVAKSYYIDALNAAEAAKAHRDTRNQIKQKILLMECYQKYYHLMDQAQILESMEDFESAHKFYEDALNYAQFENLNVSGTDSLRMRTQLMAQTADLCKSLCSIEQLNLEGEYAEARNKYHHWVDEAESMQYKWKKYHFPTDFVQKVDSITDFLEDDRNTSLPYRLMFPNEYLVMDNYLFQLLDKTACQNPQTIESDITFVFSLDTNGVIKQYISGNQLDNYFNEALIAELRNVQMSQPYRYGFSMPVKEEVRYHISSSKTSVWVEKSKKGYNIKDPKLKKQYMDEFRSYLSTAPEGKYLFLIHRNVIDDKVLSSVRLTNAKGGKAKKWMKNL